MLSCPGEDSAPAAVPLVFGPPARRLFGWYHAARPGRSPARAVVLCSPWGYEALCTHASYRYLAEQLAAAGIPALRFDYDGTGDSFGSDEDEGRVEHWLASIGAAVDTLRCRSRAAAICLFGVRLGATLAAVAAAARGDVSELVLWAPCRSGQSFLRELRALRALHGQSEPPPAGGQEGEEAAGFVLTRATLDALRQVDAASLTTRPASRALLIARDDLPEDQRLSRTLVGLGTDVTQVSWPGYAAMMRDAQDTVIPRETITSLIDWIGSQSPPGVSEARTAATECSVGNLLKAADYTEGPLQWGDDVPVFGVLTRPRADGPRGRTAVLLLSVGANLHVGPGRMYVTLARRLAADGFPVLRLDVPGVGDSATGRSPARDHLYSPTAVQDVQAAMDQLEKCVGAERFVLIGLCSGASMAYQTTVEDPRVIGQVLINPQTFSWKTGDSLEVLMRQSYRPTRSYLTALGSTQALKRLMFQQVDARGILNALGSRLRARGGVALRSLLSRTLRRGPFETEVGRNFRVIAERGADTLSIFAAEDTGLEMTLLHLGATACGLRRLKNLHLTVIDGADHTFTQKTAREEMLSAIRRHLVEKW